jgi:lipoteichoic acid synthase
VRFIFVVEKKIWSSPTLHLLLLCLGLSIYKLYLLEDLSRDLFGCHFCVADKAIVYESQFLLIILALHLLTGFIRQSALCLLVRFMVVVVVLITIIDLIVLNQFTTRFTLPMFLQFINELKAVQGFMQHLFFGVWRAISAIFGTLLILAVLIRYLICADRSGRSTVLFLSVFSGMIWGGLARTMELHTPYIKSSIEAFFDSQTRYTSYSERFKASVPCDSLQEAQYFDGEGVRPNLILLVVESFSMYHSASFSGIHDWVPHFDALADKGRRFTNFYANGNRTEQGLVALLTGQSPVVKGRGRGSVLLDEYRTSSDSVPRSLRELGYYSLFLTTANLGFLGIGNWLDDIGFDEREGHDAPYYRGMKRILFDAAPDGALYGRALQRLQELRQEANTPFFMTLETVTTHHPYIDPESGIHSQELTFRYADRELGRFVTSLESNGFFENGYLLIMSDHRAMVPLSAEEKAKYGDRAYTRIPFLILGPGLDGQEESNSFSQSDLLPSLRHWLGKGLIFVGPDQGIFLPKAIRTPRCILTHRSYNLDNLYVHCGSQDYVINLNGDDTRYIGSRSGPAELLAEVNRLRLDMLKQGKQLTQGSWCTVTQP